MSNWILYFFLSIHWSIWLNDRPSQLTNGGGFIIPGVVQIPNVLLYPKAEIIFDPLCCRSFVVKSVLILNIFFKSISDILLSFFLPFFQSYVFDPNFLVKYYRNLQSLIWRKTNFQNKSFLKAQVIKMIPTFFLFALKSNVYTRNNKFLKNGQKTVLLSFLYCFVYFLLR